MPGKYTDGYTKDAQKAKFVRHRDIKMKDSELRKEAKIQKLMCEGICKRCREKVQWKFRFDKYKPLKNPATCQQCRQKTINKAYRTLCERCAVERNICPGCCETMEDGIDKGVVVGGVVASEEEGFAGSTVVDADDGMVWGEQVEDGEITTTAETNHIDEAGGDVDDEDNIDESREYGMDLAWNEKKFHNIAASKYSKHRTTGNEDHYH